MVTLKPEIILKIKKDSVLYGKVAESLGVTTASLRSVLRGNLPKLTQAGTMIVLRDHLGLSDKDLLLIPKN